MFLVSLVKLKGGTFCLRLHILLDKRQRPLKVQLACGQIAINGNSFVFLPTDVFRLSLTLLSLQLISFSPQSLVCTVFQSLRNAEFSLRKGFGKHFAAV